MRSRVEARAAESGFDSVQEYVKALLLADAAAGATLDDERIETLLLGRIDGPFVDVDAADFHRLREKLGERPGAADGPPERLP